MCDSPIENEVFPGHMFGYRVAVIRGKSVDKHEIT